MSDDIFKGMPRRLKIGSSMVRVLVTTPTERPELIDTDNGDPLDGYTIYEQALVLINEVHAKKAQLDHVLNTVQHEISHYINMVYGVTDESNEETFVCQHTNGLVAFWIDNPRFDGWRRRLLREIAKQRAAKDDV